MKRSTVIIIVLAICLMIFSSCIQAGNISDRRMSWSMSGGEGRRFVSQETICNQTKVHWDLKLSNTLTWSNIVSDGRFIYAVINSSGGFEIVKIRIANGGVLSRFVFRELPKSLTYQLELSEDILVVLCETEMISISTKKMTLLWREKTRKNNIISFSVSNNQIFCATSDYQAISLDIKTGMPLWQKNIKNGFDYQFITANKSIVVVTGFGQGEGESLTTALLAENGTKIWSYPSDGVATKPPQISTDNVYITETGRFTCLDIKNGNYKWSAIFNDFETKQPKIIDVTPSISEKRIIVIIGENLYVIDSINGHRKKTISLPETIVPKFVVQTKNSLFAVSDGEPFMYQFDLDKFDILTKYSGGIREITGALITNKIILQGRNSIVCYECGADQE